MPVKNKIDEARSQYPDIMSLINSKLFDSGITYYASQTQIVIPKRKKEEVLNIIYSLPIDADSLFILVDVLLRVRVQALPLYDDDHACCP